MDPDKIELENLSKSFEYFKLANGIYSINCIDTLKNIAKSYIKLHFKQQEVISSIAISFDSAGID
jgi:hypothetical protein